MIEQNYYAELQNISNSINQTIGIQRAIERCEQNPELEESGLTEVPSNESISCKKVFQIYKGTLLEKIKNILF